MNISRFQDQWQWHIAVVKLCIWELKMQRIVKINSQYMYLLKGKKHIAEFFLCVREELPQLQAHFCVFL